VRLDRELSTSIPAVLLDSASSAMQNPEHDVIVVGAGNAGSRMEHSADIAGGLPVEIVSCPLCHAPRSTPLFVQRDLALGIPGRYTVARCDGCGLLYQNPRVRAAQLALAYPDAYAAHVREPDLSRRLRRHGASVRWLLSRRLGYDHLPTDDVGWIDRLRAAALRRRILEAFPPWTGGGRLLDVGCASGKFLRQMRAVGWNVAGIEVDEPAAARARAVTPNVIVGDPAQVTLPDGAFDVITALHVIEHVPDPLGTLRNVLRWLAPGGVIVVEVPNAAGVGARIFGRYWCGYDLPRHLVHFTPQTMTAMVERAGGRVAAIRHRTKPRYISRSLKAWLGDHDHLASRLGRAAVSSRLGSGVLKLLLEIVMPAARPLGLGEAVRYVIVPAESRSGA
jgi:2-polyprenyl-3-methyl-5-hydroxy-6-metoxy-1,4-benzoquinol methylase